MATLKMRIGQLEDNITASMELIVKMTKQMDIDKDQSLSSKKAWIKEINIQIKFIDHEQKIINELTHEMKNEPNQKIYSGQEIKDSLTDPE